MVKLTPFQLKLLDWIACSGGATKIAHTRRTANILLRNALVDYDEPTDSWSLTEAGRLALETKKGA